MKGTGVSMPMQPLWDKRAHKRVDLTCPVSIAGADGDDWLQSRSRNISDGGVYLTVPVAELPEGSLPETLTVRISLPRSTNNSFMFEPLEAPAAIVRTEPLTDGQYIGVAMRFAEPMKMDLEV